MGTFAAGWTVSITPASIPSHWDGKQHCWWEEPNTDNNRSRRQSMAAGYRWEVLTTNDPVCRVTLWIEIVSRAMAYYCWTYILVLVDKSRLGSRLLTYGKTSVYVYSQGVQSFIWSLHHLYCFSMIVYSRSHHCKLSICYCFAGSVLYETGVCKKIVDRVKSWSVTGLLPVSNG